jgi:hypothetical protein
MLQYMASFLFLNFTFVRMHVCGKTALLLSWSIGIQPLQKCKLPCYEDLVGTDGDGLMSAQVLNALAAPGKDRTHDDIDAILGLLDQVKVCYVPSGLHVHLGYAQIKMREHWFFDTTFCIGSLSMHLRTEIRGHRRFQAK